MNAADGIVAAAPLFQWVVTEGLNGNSVAPLLEGFALRLCEAGVPLCRAHISFPTVSPRMRARNIVWRFAGGTEESSVDHDAFEPAYGASPFPDMLRQGLTTRRWRLAMPDDAEGFHLLRTLHAEGVSDHIVHLTQFASSPSPVLLGASLSFSTHDPDGFSPRDETLFALLAPAAGLAAYRIILSELAVDLLDAYVGRDAGRHVLSGEIRRGIGHEVTAALMFADLRGFTVATEQHGGSAVIERLGRHLTAMAEPVEDSGGEVLKLLGDGLLAAFPAIGGDGERTACATALAAARDALRRNAAVNATLPDRPPLHLDVALHFGTVFYGNVGAGSRLDFTVIGPAVNEASRIEGLCDRLGEHLLMSEPFARACGQAVESLGAHELRNVAAPREVFRLA